VWVSRIATLGWTAFAVGFAEYASRLGSLIEAVNILGSLFYGTILGIFLTAFLLRRVDGTAVFVAALAIGPFTGAALNPARAVGPALVFKEWHAQAAYWIGPLIGAGLAALLWDKFLLRKNV